MITISSTLVYEAKVRGDRFWKELDLVAINVMSLSAGARATPVLCAVLYGWAVLDALSSAGCA